jgi:hypothetical protein
MSESYDKLVHTRGRIWTLAALILIMSVPLCISVYFDIWPPLTRLLAGILPTVMVFWPIAVIEVLTYSPMLGSSGAYLGFITGNMSNLKVPAVVQAMNNAGVEPASKEGEIVSALATGASSLVTNVVLVIGVLLMSRLMPLLQSPVLKPAFENLLAALFGGLGVVLISKNVKLAITPLVIAVGFFIAVPSIPIGILIPISVIVTILVARILYKKKIV